MTVRKFVAICCMCLSLMGAKLSCATSSGLPVHTRAHWLQQILPTGQVIVILRPGIKPPPVMRRGTVIPGYWTHKGDTYLGSHVWVWSAGYPNGHAN
jgi:hypothetical protein